MRESWRAFTAAMSLGWRAAPALSVISVALMAVGSVLPALAAWCGKLVVDGLTRRTGDSSLVWYAFGMVLFGGGSMLLGHLATVAAAAQQRSVTLRVEGNLYTAINRLIGLRHFEDPQFQDRLRLAQQSASGTPSAVANLMVALVRSLVTAVAFLGVVAAVWWPMLLLLVAAAAPALWVQLMLARQTAQTSEAIIGMSRQRFQYQMLLTDVVAAKEIRLFGLGELFHRRIAAVLDETSRRELRTAGRAAFTQAGLTALTLAVSGVGAVVVMLRAIDGQLTAGDVMLFIAAVSGVQAVFGGTVSQLTTVGRSLLLFKHYLAIVATDADMVDGQQPAGPLRGALEFHDVWFRYMDDGPWVLRGVSLRIPAGSVVGVVGVNGAGKSSLVKLACRFYDPQRGRITWDGTDLRDLSAAELRSRLGVTFQDFVTYELTAAENIGVGDVARLDDLDRIRSAAGQAEADSVIEALPQGYDTMLTRLFAVDDGPGGVALSGGQAQRVALARSLMRRDADVLIHDEPCASLDALAAERVTARLTEMRAGRTTVVVSHRLAALRSADKIVVLDGGVVDAEGTHDELMTSGGRYRDMFTAQAAAYQDARVAVGGGTP